MNEWTEERIREALVMCERATSGPLRAVRDGRACIIDPAKSGDFEEDVVEIGEFDREADTRFFVTARTDYPSALRALSDANKSNQVLVDTIWRLVDIQHSERAAVLAENKRLRDLLRRARVRLVDEPDSKVLAAEIDAALTGTPTDAARDHRYYPQSLVGTEFASVFDRVLGHFGVGPLSRDDGIGGKSWGGAMALKIADRPTRDCLGAESERAILRDCERRTRRPREP